MGKSWKPEIGPTTGRPPLGILNAVSASKHPTILMLFLTPPQACRIISSNMYQLFILSNITFPPFRNGIRSHFFRCACSAAFAAMGENRGMSGPAALLRASVARTAGLPLRVLHCSRYRAVSITQNNLTNKADKFTSGVLRAIPLCHTGKTEGRVSHKEQGLSNPAPSVKQAGAFAS